MIVIYSIVLDDGFMELQQLRYVLAVVETRNFTRAARQCYVVQSALSHQVAKLEQELGVSLFARTSRRVEPTAAGEAFLPWARACLHAAEQASASAKSAAGVVSGPLRVGLIPTATAIEIPMLLGRIRDAYPEVSVQLRVGSSDDLIEGVREGAFDLAVVGLADEIQPAGVAHRVLKREALVAAVPDGHRLASRKTVTLVELADEPFVDFPAGGPGRVQSDRAFEAAGLTRQVTYEASSPQLIGDIVSGGLAVALLPSSFAPSSDARTLKVRGGPHRTEYLVWSDFAPSAAAAAVLDLID